MLSHRHRETQRTTSQISTILLRYCYTHYSLGIFGCLERPKWIQPLSTDPGLDLAGSHFRSLGLGAQSVGAVARTTPPTCLRSLCMMRELQKTNRLFRFNRSPHLRCLSDAKFCRVTTLSIGSFTRKATSEAEQLCKSLYRTS